MTITEVINKYHLNTTYLATEIGMLPATFNLKLHPRHQSKFTNDELTRIHDVLVGLKCDIDSIDSSEFDDIMKAICNNI